jgi:hypothetical protein
MLFSCEIRNSSLIFNLISAASWAATSHDLTSHGLTGSHLPSNSNHD